MDVLYRDAAQKASQGRDASVARILTLAAREDPARAGEWRRHLVPAAPAGGASLPGLSALLAEMRSGGERPFEPAPAPPPVERAATPEGQALRFHLAIDDGGEFLVLCGDSISLGHARAGRADVPLLADLESVHARLEFRESFHGGPVWCVTSTGRGRLEVDGRPIAGASELADGAEVRLAENLAFRFRRPETASASVLLELLRGAEAAGAQHVLLMVPGRAGRVRVGSKSNRHIPVPRIEHEIELCLAAGDGGDQLVVSCPGGVREVGGGEGSAATEARFPCPPSRRVDVVLGARPSERPPFGLSFAPLDSPTAQGGPV